MKRKKRQTITRRQSISLIGSSLIAGGAGLLAKQPAITTRAQEADSQLIVLDPAARFRLSPYLYMQFMEPLGATDGSVEAAWDHLGDGWREDLLEVTREL